MTDQVARIRLGTSPECQEVAARESSKGGMFHVERYGPIIVFRAKKNRKHCQSFSGSAFRFYGHQWVPLFRLLGLPPQNRV